MLNRLPKFVIVPLIVVVLLLVFELVALARLKMSVNRFAGYWNLHNTTATGEITYVALGDSTAQGIGASSPEKGYVSLLAKRIADSTGRSVRVVNVSTAGARIRDVIEYQLPRLAAERPAIVTVAIGANDVTKYDADAFAADYAELIHRLPRTTIIGNLPYFGGRVRINDKALAANETIEVLAKRYNLPVANIQTETRRQNTIWTYAADYFHPNNRGYRNWDKAFWNVIEPSQTSYFP